MATGFLLTRKIYNFGHILWPQKMHCYTSEILAEVAAKNPDVIHVMICYFIFILFYF